MGDVHRSMGRRDGLRVAVTVTARAVLRGLSEAGDDLRAAVLADFAAHGGDRNRWQRRDWMAMADAVTRAEDRLELEMRGRVTEARRTLRGVRRKLELAVGDV